MSIKIRRRLLLTVILATAAVVLLSLSLSQLDLNPGTPFPAASQPENSQGTVPSPGLIKAYNPPVLLQGIIGLGLAAYLLFLVFRASKNLKIKQKFHSRILPLVLLIIAFIVISVIFSRYLRESTNPGSLPGIPAVSFPVSPIGQPPVLFVGLAIFSLVVIAGLLTAIFMRQQNREAVISEPVLKAVNNAILSINQGENISSVVLRCYSQMSQALLQESNVERLGSMTAREFEAILQEHGLPYEPVHQLTMLFEEARYGHREPGDEAARKAIGALNEIIRFIRGGAR